MAPPAGTVWRMKSKKTVQALDRWEDARLAKREAAYWNSYVIWFFGIVFVLMGVDGGSLALVAAGIATFLMGLVARRIGLKAKSERKAIEAANEMPGK